MSTARVKRNLRYLLPCVAVLTFSFAVNLWTLRHPARLDVTSNRVYSITPETRGILDRLRQPVEIVFFYDVRSRAMLDARYLLEQYARRSPFVTVRSYDPVLQPALAARYGVRFAGTAVFRSGTRRVVVNRPTETELTNALIRVSSDAVGRICFTDGHIESNPFSLQTHDHYEGGAGPHAHGHNHAAGGRPLELHERHGMGMARNALETLGYAVDRRVLLQGEDPLAGCTVVVVASPQRPFQPSERAVLERWVDGAGPVLLMLEPYVRHGLEALLARFGVRHSGAGVVDPRHYYRTEPRTPAVSDYARHPVTRNVALSFFPGVAELSPMPHAVPDDLVITPLVQTSDASVLTGGADDTPSARTIMLEARGRTGGRHRVHAIIAGDGDFATNSFFAALGNGELFLNAVTRLAGDDALIDITPHNYAVAELRLTAAQLRLTFLLTVLAGPLALAAAGIAVWRSRARGASS